MTCRVCKSGGVNVYLKGDEGHLTASDLGASRLTASHARILRCLECGHAFATTDLNGAKLGDLYRCMEPAGYEAEASSKIVTARRHAGLVEQYAQGGDLLDVGCASGYFLEIMAQHGWRTTGIEPSLALSRSAAQRLSGRSSILNTVLEEADIPASTIDVITAWDVLEHVADPVLFIQRCASFLRPGGFLFAKVPDIESVQARLLGSRWPLLLPEHLSYFSRRSIAMCGRLANLEPVRFSRAPVTYSIDYLLFRMGQHRIAGARLARKVLAGLRLGHAKVSVRVGEWYGIWRKPVPGSA